MCNNTICSTRDSGAASQFRVRDLSKRQHVCRPFCATFTATFGFCAFDPHLENAAMSFVVGRALKMNPEPGQAGRHVRERRRKEEGGGPSMTSCDDNAWKQHKLIVPHVGGIRGRSCSLTAAVLLCVVHWLCVFSKMMFESASKPNRGQLASTVTDVCLK